MKSPLHPVVGRLVGAAGPGRKTPRHRPRPDIAKGQALSTQVCAACHTADGSRGSPANPIIAGQHPEYLAKQLGSSSRASATTR